VYVYGVTASGRTIAVQGIGDTPVSTVEHGELAAIVSRHPVTTIRAKRRDLLRHSDVLQAAFATGPVVPLRFGTVLESEDAVLDTFLGARYEELVGLLQRVEGLAELRVRAVFDEDALLAEIVRDDQRVASLRTVPGANQVVLGEAVAHAIAARRLATADEAVATLVRHAVDVNVDEPREELEVLRGSFLVEAAKVNAFEAAANELARIHHHHMTLDLIGPMPPHSFVALDAGSR
jgi:Gas vesicle synthesis protein GvpL/GvpF